MAVVFEALVKNDENGGWFIELKDTLDDRMVVCKNLQEFEVQIQELANHYGGRVDEVQWVSHESLSPENMQEVRVGMMKYHEKYKDQLDNEEEK